MRFVADVLDELSRVERHMNIGGERLVSLRAKPLRTRQQRRAGDAEKDRDTLLGLRSETKSEEFFIARVLITVLVGREIDVHADGAWALARYGVDRGAQRPSRSRRIPVRHEIDDVNDTDRDLRRGETSLQQVISDGLDAFADAGVLEGAASRRRGWR